jgi:hypothetical protein
MLDITNQIPVCVCNTNPKPKRSLDFEEDVGLVRHVALVLFYPFSNCPLIGPHLPLSKFFPLKKSDKDIAVPKGFCLDPVYTGKAFAGMLDLIEKGGLGANEPIIFLHTGGLLALFA